MLITGERKAISNWLRQFKTLIDPIKGLYKIQETFLGLFHSGHFRTLPDIDYVLIFRALFAKCESCSLEDFEKNSYFQVSLIHRKKHRIIFHETRNKDEAWEYARLLSSELKRPIMDSATIPGKGRWAAN